MENTTVKNDIIKVDGLKKSYGDINAVCGISFVVKEGELFAFLGLNGAGKSTTINILSGCLDKDGGKVFIAGNDLDDGKEDVKANIGIVFQNSVLDSVLSVKDNLRFRAGLYGISVKAADERIAVLAQMLNLDELLSRKVKTLSGGQRRRADIARALIHSPSILIMDEPTTGLDPQTRNLLWDTVNRLRADGLTVFLTTHYMEEAAGADYVVIIDEGAVAAKGTPLQLKNRYTTDCLKLYTLEKQRLQALFTGEGFNVQTFLDGLIISVPSTLQAKELILKHQNIFTDFEVQKGDMNSVFLNVTGKHLRND